MRRAILLLLLLAAPAAAGCGAARPASAPPPRAAAFPLVLPPGAVLAFAVRQGPLFAGGPSAAIPTSVQAMALAADRRVFVSCHSGAPLTPAGTVTVATAQRWAGLLAAGHLGSLRSDAFNARSRGFWFMREGRTVYLDFARHVRRAPCTGTECTAALHIDATLRALGPAIAALGAVPATHCASA